jgi:HAE1 family hydrophobic/amphiphilic exporter-1
MDYTVSKLIEVESVIQKYDSDIASVFSSVGLGSRGQVNRGYISIRLKEKGERDRSQTEIMELLKQDLVIAIWGKGFPCRSVYCQRKSFRKITILSHWSWN